MYTSPGFRGFVFSQGLSPGGQASLRLTTILLPQVSQVLRLQRWATLPAQTFLPKENYAYFIKTFIIFIRQSTETAATHLRILGFVVITINAYGCFACIYVCNMCESLVTQKARNGCHICKDWSYRWLRAAMWVLGIQLRSSQRAGNSLTQSGISPVLLLFCFVLFWYVSKDRSLL